MPCSKSLIAAAACSLVCLSAATASAKPYKGAEVYQLEPFLYGKVAMRMKLARGSGILSTFFLYKDGSEGVGEFWEEIDIEGMGKDDSRTWQSNIITGLKKTMSQEVHDAGVALADGYHTYVLEWAPTYVAWFFDGREVRRTEGGQAAELTNPETIRFNLWISTLPEWAGAFDEAALPAHQFVNWVKYYRYQDGKFVLDWSDDFETFDAKRWGKGDWTWAENRSDHSPLNATVKDGTLVLTLTKEGQTGFSGEVPVDPGEPDGGFVVADAARSDGDATASDGAATDAADSAREGGRADSTAVTSGSSGSSGKPRATSGTSGGASGNATSGKTSGASGKTGATTGSSSGRSEPSGSSDEETSGVTSSKGGCSMAAAAMTQQSQVPWGLLALAGVVWSRRRARLAKMHNDAIGHR